MQKLKWAYWVFQNYPSLPLLLLVSILKAKRFTAVLSALIHTLSGFRSLAEIFKSPPHFYRPYSQFYM